MIQEVCCDDKISSLDLSVYNAEIQLFHQLLECQAVISSNTVVVQYYNTSLTYAELNKRANQFARYLESRGIVKGSYVGIHVRRSIDLAVIIFGILKCGAICMPLDVLAPIDRIRYIISQVDFDCLVYDTKEVFAELTNDLSFDLIEYDELACARYSDCNLKNIYQPSDVAYVLFTSGSTGKPKGVVLLHQGIVNLAFQKVQVFELEQAPKILQFSSIAFDAFLSEFGISLVTGGTLVISDHEDILPGKPLIRTLRDFDVNLIIAAPSILMTLIDADLPDLKVIFSAGEICPPHLANTLSKKYILVNAYGPTEVSVCTTMYKVDRDCTYTDHVPIGKPIGGITVAVLDKKQRPVADGEQGELFIGGKGVAYGYLNNAEKTKEHFISIAGQKYYKTGDLARILPDGSLEFIGRKDRQIKYRGIRINLDEIEHILCQHDLIENAAVNFDDKFSAYVQIIKNSRLDVIAIRSYLKSYFPVRMIPNDIVLVAELPLTLSNKIDYQALRKIKKNRKPKNIEKQGWNDTEKTLLRLMSNFVFEDIERDSNIFDLGLDSFSVVAFVDRANEEFNIEIPIKKVYELPTICELAAQIEGKKENSTDDVIDFRQEIRIDKALPEDFSTENIPVASGLKSNVLITGSTGYIGIFLLEKILRETKATVYCLVRAPNEEAALRKLKLTAVTYLANIDWNAYLPRIRLILGDISKPNLGMESDQYMMLGDKVDAIYHLGGNTNFIKSYASIKPANVVGAEEILRFAVSNKKKLIPVNYMSTLAIFSCIHYFEEVYIIDENSDAYKSHPYLKYDIGYVQSKWVADNLMQQAIQVGMPVSIYRPGFVLCHSKTGAIAPSHFWHSYVKECLHLKAYPELIEQKEEFVAVDFVVDALFCLSNAPGSMQKIYHLCPPPEDNIDNIECFKEIQGHLNFSMKQLPYKEWLSAVQKDMAVNGKNNTLYPFLPLLRDRVYKGRTALELYQHTPDCIGIAGEKILQKAGISPGSMRDLFKKYSYKVGKKYVK